MANEFNNLSKEQLIEYINNLRRQLNNEKYGLYFDRKATPEEIVEESKRKIPILKREKTLDLSFGKNNNLLIEGDNFISLSALSTINPGQGFISVIYIDPPYNTGKKDFTYNDKYVDQEDGYRHTKWLNFMEKRLKLAHSLLTDKGIIFISIDDREYAQLKLLCDSIFAEKNYIATLKWKKKKQPSFLSRVAGVLEYVVVYAKDISNIRKLSVESLNDSDKPIINSGNPVSERTFRKGLRAKCKDGVIKAGTYQNKSMSIEFLNDIEIKKGRTINSFTAKAQFRTSQEFIDSFCNDDLIFITSNYGLRRDLSSDEQGGAKTITDLLIDWGQNQDGSAELKDIFNITKNEIPFTNPKPVLLIKNCIKSTMNKEAIVMDFFAGSGTTAQAVLELNKEDGGNRKFILCTNNEGNIMSDVCYPRIKTVVTGKRQDGTKYSNGIEENVIYLKTDFIDNSSSKDQIKYNLVHEVDSLLCIAEDSFEEIEQQNKYSIYSNNEGTRLTVVFRDFYDQIEFSRLEKFFEQNKDKHIIFYQFSTDNTVDENVFKSHKNVLVKPIPNKIYEIYKTIAEDIKREY